MPNRCLERLEVVFENTGRECNSSGRDHYNGRERKEEADRDGALSSLHELSRDIVDSRNMVSIDGMSKPERVGKESRAQQHGTHAMQ